MQHAKRAYPDVLHMGEQTTITLHVAVECPDSASLHEEAAGTPRKSTESRRQTSVERLTVTDTLPNYMHLVPDTVDPDRTQLRFDVVGRPTKPQGTIER